MPKKRLNARNGTRKLQGYLDHLRLALRLGIQQSNAVNAFEERGC